MPRFRVTMESPDLKREDGSSHVRVTTLQAEDEDAARVYCERQEMRIAVHEYPADTLADLEAAEGDAEAAGVRPSAQVRMQLATHRQTEPYEIVDIEEVS